MVRKVELRYRLAVVTGAGTGAGREVAVALSRRGAAVLAVDPDAEAAEETASLVGEARVRAWSLQADLVDETEVQLMAARSRDLGGADVLVTTTSGRTGVQPPWPIASSGARSPALDLHLGVPVRLTQAFLAAQEGRCDGSPAIVHVGPTLTKAAPEVAAGAAGLVGFTRSLRDPTLAGGVRVMAVLPDPARPARTSGVVVDLLCRGDAGEVVDLSAG